MKDDEELYLLLSRRNCGQVTYGYEVRKELKEEELKEDFLKRMGQDPKKIKGNWKQADRSYAKNILTSIFSKDLNQHSDLETKPVAEQISNYFLEKFSSESIFYTNGLFELNSEYLKLYQWTSITNSKFYTYDTGVVAVDKHIIGMLWAADPL